MKKNGWFFGDSFTSGFGLNFDCEINVINLYQSKLKKEIINKEIKKEKKLI